MLRWPYRTAWPRGKRYSDLLLIDSDSNELQNTNVVELFSCLRMDDANRQRIYYQVCSLFQRSFLFDFSMALVFFRQEQEDTFHKASLPLYLFGARNSWTKRLPGAFTPTSPLWSVSAIQCLRYIDKHVMDGYKFLMQNYRKGDKICLFGRNACTEFV